MQDRTTQHNNTPHKKHTTLNETVYMQNYNNKKSRTHYTLLRLKTTRHTKQPVNHTTYTQLHTFHQDLPLTPPHYPYIHLTSHPTLTPFPPQHFADLHPTSNSLYFTSFHISHFNPCFWKPHFLCTSESFHFTSLIYLIFPHFKIPSHT